MPAAADDRITRPRGNDGGERDGRRGIFDLGEPMAFHAMLCVVSNDGSVDERSVVQAFSLGAERNSRE